MACNCQKGKNKQFEVVADGGTGKVLFSSTNEGTARTVAGRYPGSVVRDKSQAAKADAEAEPAAK